MLLTNELADAMPAQTEDGCKDKNGQDCFAEDMDISTITYEMLQKALSWYFGDSDSDSEEIECDECCKGISYDDCVHITEDEYMCKECGVDADGKVIPDICIECYKRPCKCDSESDDDFEKDKCEAKELIEQMKKNGHIGIIVDEQEGMKPNVRSLFTKEDIRQAELKKMALNGELKELLSKHDFKLVSDPNKGKQSEIAIFK